MPTHHPLTATIRRRLVSIGLVVGGIIVQWALLAYYNHTAPLSALTDSVVSIGTFSVLCYYLWYATGLNRVPQVEVVLTIIAVTIWLTGSYIGQYIGEHLCPAGSSSHFTDTLPLRLFFGLLMWLCVTIWYRNQHLSHWKKERLLAEEVKAIETEEMIDRIVVKDGSRIHIIPLNDIAYVQAGGDYVNIVSVNGQYLKEQTMKALEAQLPATKFIRTHRSYIINVDYIKRVELYGKDSYNVLLKNGEIAKASSNGYKQLKERLSI